MTETVRVGVEHSFAQKPRGYEVATTIFHLLFVYVCLCLLILCMLSMLYLFLINVAFRW